MASQPAFYQPARAGSVATFRPPVIDRILASTLPPRLRVTLIAFVRASKFGQDKYWPATLKVALEAGLSYRTTQRHIHRLVELGILTLLFEANTVVPRRGLRRSNTYDLNQSAIRTRPTTPDKLSGVTDRQGTPDKVTCKGSKSSEEEQHPLTPSDRKMPTNTNGNGNRNPAPLEAKQNKSHTRPLTVRQVRELRAEAGFQHKHNSDPQITWAGAFQLACGYLVIPVESAIRALAEAGDEQTAADLATLHREGSKYDA